MYKKMSVKNKVENQRKRESIHSIFFLLFRNSLYA